MQLHMGVLIHSLTVLPSNNQPLETLFSRPHLSTIVIRPIIIIAYVPNVRELLVVVVMAELRQSRVRI